LLGPGYGWWGGLSDGRGSKDRERVRAGKQGKGFKGNEDGKRRSRPTAVEKLQT